MRAGECFTLAAVTALICETAWNKTPVIFHRETSGHNFFVCVCLKENGRELKCLDTPLCECQNPGWIENSVFSTQGNNIRIIPGLSRLCLFIVFQYLQLCSSIFHIIPRLFPRVLSLCWFDVLLSGGSFHKFLLFPLRNLLFMIPNKSRDC